MYQYKNTRIVTILLLLFLIYVAISGKRIKKGLICEDQMRRSSFLWTMKRHPPVHFFGTIHVPYKRVWDHIPKASKAAFESSDNIFFELDLTNSRTMAALNRCQFLPRGARLREILPSDLYQGLKQHLDYVKKAMPDWITTEQRIRGYDGKEIYESIVGDWEHKKPIWTMLMINSLTKEDVRSRGTPVLDLHLARQANRLGKEVGAIESVDEQCQPLDGLNITQVSFALNHTLWTLEKLRQGKLEAPYTTDDLIKQYSCGDIDSVRLDIESMQVPLMSNNSDQTDFSNGGFNNEDRAVATDIDSYFKTKLIFRRNQLMAERVKTLLKENPDKSFFFAFGTGHFLGNGSVIDLLTQDGFKIRNVKDKTTSRAGIQSGRRRRQRRLRQRRQKNRRKRRRHRYHRDMWIPIKDQNKRTQQKQSQQKTFGKTYFYQTKPRVVDNYPTLLPFLPYKDWDRESRNTRDSRLKIFNAASSKTREYSYADSKTFTFKMPSGTRVQSSSAGSGAIHFSFWSYYYLTRALPLVVALLKLMDG